MANDDARFGFGKNWSRFLEQVDDERIASSMTALKERLGLDSLSGKRFLDIGSGSGLSSLAARRLGAEVHSFDYDADSVACTTELRRRYFPDDPTWHVERGSVLDREYMSRLGVFDVVYAWGVLHHTGDMVTALGQAADRVGPGGLLFIAIYNDQGPTSRRWTSIKRLYNRSGNIGRKLLVGGVGAYFAAAAVTRRLARFEKPVPTTYFKERKSTRGMSVWHDLVDWVGGYPFEVAKPEEIFRFYHSRGFDLVEMVTCGGSLGCNEFVFRRR